jgi:predicted secreted protein
MKRILLLSIIFTLAIPLAICQPSGEVAIHKGDIYVITLNEKPSTGYTWYLTYSDGLELMSEKLTPSTNRSSGATGTRELKLQAIQMGKQVITGKYQRPWEKSPIHTFNLTLNVI